MSLPIQNLHDLVLGLATDNALGSAFLTDPGAVLSGAGLTDITALDVQEVTPLVADSLPSPVAAAIESALGNIPADALGVNDLTGAVSQLQTVAGAVQALPADVAGTDFALSGSGVEGATGTLSSDAAGLGGTLTAGVEGVTGDLNVADTPLGGVTGAVTASADAAGAGLQSPLGTYGLVTDGMSLPSFDSLGDLSGSLDSAALSGSADSTPFGETLSNYVSSAGSFAEGTVADNAATLAGHVSSVSGLATAQVESGGEAFASGIDTVTGAVSGGVAQAPSLPIPNALPHDLPAHAVADLPQSLPAPDVAPQVTHAVEGTLSHSPLAGATSGSLPDVSHLDAGSAHSAAHSAVSSVHETVDHAVSQSPLGDTLHGALPDAGNLLPTDALHDLPLGPLG